MSSQKALDVILLIMEKEVSHSLSVGETCLKLSGLFNMGTAPFKAIMDKGNLVPLTDGDELVGVFYPRKHIKFLTDEAAQRVRGMSEEERKAIPTHCENALFLLRRTLIIGKKHRLKRVKTEKFIAKKITIQKKTEAEEVVPYISTKIRVSDFKCGRIRKEAFKVIIEKNQLIAFTVEKQAVAYFCPRKLFEAWGKVGVPEAVPVQSKPRGCSKRLTRAEEREIFEDFLRRIPARELAARYDVSRRTIFNVIERNTPEQLKNRRGNQKLRKVHLNEAYHIPSSA